MGRGRPRKHKHREKSGRGSRAAEERSNREFAAWQRRHLDVPPDLVLLPEAGSPLGRMLLRDEISRREFELGKMYRAVIYRFKLVCGLPFDLPSRLGVRGANNFEFPPDVVTTVRRRYSRMQKTLHRAGEGVADALYVCCWREEEGSQPNLVQRGLRALDGSDL